MRRARKLRSELSWPIEAVDRREFELRRERIGYATAVPPDHVEAEWRTA